MMNKPEVLVALLHESILSRATSRNKTSGDSTEIPSSSAPNRSGTIQSTLSVIHVDTAVLVARNAPQNLSRNESNQLVLDSLRAAITFAVTSPSHSPAERAAHLNECLDSFTSSCTLGQKEFDRVLSETLPAIGMTALEYEIFRWDPIWEEDYGTLELSVTHSEIGTGLEAVKFIIDHWIPQSTDHTHWRKLMDLVRRACLYRTRGVSSTLLLGMLLSMLRAFTILADPIIYPQSIRVDQRLVIEVPHLSFPVTRTTTLPGGKPTKSTLIALEGVTCRGYYMITISPPQGFGLSQHRLQRRVPLQFTRKHRRYSKHHLIAQHCVSSSLEVHGYGRLMSGNAL